eukprot:6434586-Prymnesium_polylepis.1
MKELLTSLARFEPLIEKEAEPLRSVRRHVLSRCVQSLQKILGLETRPVVVAKGAEWRTNHMVLRLAIDASRFAAPARLRPTGVAVDS